MYKPAWSEEDEEMLKMVIKLCEQCGNEYAYYWLKSLKERILPKQEWSEEDEEHIKSLLERLEGMCKKDATFIRTKFAISEDEDWLKSLSPQPQWKPSDEQMNAFDAILVYNPPCSNECRNHLITLYNELKKLKGE